MERKTIGQHILEYRKNNHLTQQKLADMLYVSNKTVSRWELGNTEPDLDQVARLSELMGISVDILLGKSAEKETPPIASAESEELPPEEPPQAEPQQEDCKAKPKRKKVLYSALSVSFIALWLCSWFVFVGLIASGKEIESEPSAETGEVLEVCTRFEAEYALLVGDNPQLDGQRSFVERAESASNGLCVAYFGAKGNTITFEIFSTQADEKATLIVAVVSEYSEFSRHYLSSAFDGVYTLKVNNEEIKTGIEYESTNNQNPYYDFVRVPVPISLLEGENLIQLVCPRTGDGKYGLNVDYIEIETESTLSWSPYKENLIRETSESDS
jgi:transcriptional regulator with XRE-family HTH domain